MSQRNRPCSCGSGKRFKHCCGRLDASRTPAAPSQGPSPGDSPFEVGGELKPAFRGDAMAERCRDLPAGRVDGHDKAPPGLLVLKNHLPAALCEAWLEVLRARPTKHATIKVMDPATGRATFEIDPQRVTQYVDQGALAAEVRSTLITSYRDTITPFYGQALDWMERPSVLKYVPGGKYDAHADSEYWDPPSSRWVRSVDRDLSLLIYLNDDYEGGSLYLPNFDLRIQPEPGMLIAFPSDHRYLHAAEPLISGERYAVVCWATVKGSPRVATIPPHAIRP